MVLSPHRILHTVHIQSFHPLLNRNIPTLEASCSSETPGKVLGFVCFWSPALAPRLDCSVTIGVRIGWANADGVPSLEPGSSSHQFLLRDTFTFCKLWQSKPVHSLEKRKGKKNNKTNKSPCSERVDCSSRPEGWLPQGNRGAGQCVPYVSGYPFPDFPRTPPNTVPYFVPQNRFTATLSTRRCSQLLLTPDALSPAGKGTGGA